MRQGQKPFPALFTDLVPTRKRHYRKAGPNVDA